MSKVTVKKKNDIFDLSAEMIRLALLWKSDHQMGASAEQLVFIHAEPHPDGALILGCDGGAMFIGLDRKGKCPHAVNIALCPDGIRELKGDTIHARRVSGPKDCYEVTDEGETIFVSNDTWLLPDHWPDWRRIVPGEEAFNKAQAYTPRVLNSSYLGRIAEMYRGDEWSAERCVHFATKGLGHNVFVFFPWNPDMLLMLAPMKGETPQLTWPKWLEDPAGDL
jgi:hypothetical protein